MALRNMIKITAVAVLILTTWATPVRAQDRPVPEKTRLYISLQHNPHYSGGEKTFSQELEAIELSGGTLVGRTDRGLLVVDVPDPKGAEGKIKGAGLARDVVDEEPAGAGPVEKVPHVIVWYERGQREAAEGELKAAGFRIVPGKASRVRPCLVVEVPKGVSVETIRDLKRVKLVPFAQLAQPLRVPERTKDRKKETNKDEARSGSDGSHPSGGTRGVAPLVAAPGADGLPGDAHFQNGRLWGLRNARVHEAWRANLKEASVVVAVVDSGVDYTHPDLAPNMWVNEREQRGNLGEDDDGNGYVDDVHGYDFFNNDADPMDDNSHGTLCAGAIGAVADGVGVVGVCQKVKIMALKWTDPNGRNVDNNDAALCIEYAAENGAKVINVSWGFLGPRPDPRLEAAIDYAREQRALVVAAAGNEGHDNDSPEQRNYPSSSDASNVLSVMAIDRDERVPERGRNAWASNFGAARVHLAAPGDTIWSTVPGNDYDQDSGTSFAAPYVSGAAALLWSQPKYRSDSPEQIRDELIHRARKINHLDGRCKARGTLDLGFLAVPDASEQP